MPPFVFEGSKPGSKPLPEDAGTSSLRANIRNLIRSRWSRRGQRTRARKSRKSFAVVVPDALDGEGNDISSAALKGVFKLQELTAESSDKRARGFSAREGQSIFKLHYVTSDLARRQYSTPPERPTAQWSALHHRPGKAQALSQRLRVTQWGVGKPEGARDVNGRAKRIVYTTSGEGEGSLVLAWSGGKEMRWQKLDLFG
ncbi:hypothetical protein FB451DRAFT_1376004 [Mycena latifolia]|nr:hypothetical protein FB451DRAFT_1376004 [Mycena latifolia]